MRTAPLQVPCCGRPPQGSVCGNAPTQCEMIR
jgi:hypothetical protein